MTLDDLSALIRQRRSLKPAAMDAARPIDRAVLMTLLENATWAPTHGLTEPWRFRVYEGAARLALAENLQRLYREVTPAHEFREDKFVKMGESPLQAPTVVACWMQRTAGGKIPALEEIEAVACALQNAMLSATAVGLGSFWSSPPLLESATFKHWLGVRDEDVPVGLLYLGWPKAGSTAPMSVRKPVEEVTTWA